MISEKMYFTRVKNSSKEGLHFPLPFCLDTPRKAATSSERFQYLTAEIRTNCLDFFGKVSEIRFLNLGR